MNNAPEGADNDSRCPWRKQKTKSIQATVTVVMECTCSVEVPEDYDEVTDKDEIKDKVVDTIIMPPVLDLKYSTPWNINEINVEL